MHAVIPNCVLDLPLLIVFRLDYWQLRKRKVVPISSPQPKTRQRKGPISHVPPLSAAESAHNRCVRKTKQMRGMPELTHTFGHDLLIVESESLSCDILPAKPPTTHEVKAHSLLHHALANSSGSNARKVSVPQLDFDVLHSDFVKDTRSRYNGDHSMGCAESLCPNLSAGCGSKITALTAADSDTNMTDLHADIGIPDTICRDDSDDRFWEGALAQYQQILAHNGDLINRIALGIDHILSGGFQQPVVGRAEAASNRFRRKLYLADKAHTIYRQHHCMARFGQELHSRSKIFNHVVVRSIVTCEGDLKTVKTTRSWSNDVRLSILSRFSDSTYGFICDHTAGTSNQSLRAHHFVSTGNLLINEAGT
ncbi:hypothetical protein CCACVL1_03224 [Corchorus capsularis]|uniref:Uncharacterized protein n=1 Tax=Corchorus capsularis TaxID=210143 RepID=A0A1R3K1I4_COCAP|nr:hypothetical protein CCACVL1_03224 [Corchorus capsularis]